MNQEEWERHATDVALARYAVVAPLIRRQLNRDERRLELEKVVGAVHKFPDGDRKVSGRTVRRWCDWYRNGHLNEDVRERDSDPGIDGLKPARRADRHGVESMIALPWNPRSVWPGICSYLGQARVTGAR